MSWEKKYICRYQIMSGSDFDEWSGNKEQLFTSLFSRHQSSTVWTCLQIFLGLVFSMWPSSVDFSDQFLVLSLLVLGVSSCNQPVKDWALRSWVDMDTAYGALLFWANLLFTSGPSTTGPYGRNKIKRVCRQVTFTNTFWGPNAWSPKKW